MNHGLRQWLVHLLQVQKLLGHCAQHLEKGETHQGPAVLGIALIAMAEELGLDMAIRSLEHLLQYGEQNIRRVVPLALGLLCISNPKVSPVGFHLLEEAPWQITRWADTNFVSSLSSDSQVNVMDTLSRLSHDSDGEVSMVGKSESLQCSSWVHSLSSLHANLSRPLPLAGCHHLSRLHRRRHEQCPDFRHASEPLQLLLQGGRAPILCTPLFPSLAST